MMKHPFVEARCAAGDFLFGRQTRAMLAMPGGEPLRFILLLACLSLPLVPNVSIAGLVCEWTHVYISNPGTPHQRITGFDYACYDPGARSPGGPYHFPESGGGGVPGGSLSGRKGSTETESCAEADPVAPTSQPVIIESGEKILSQMDFAVGTVVPLGIGRNYYSVNAAGGAFGGRWSSTIDYGLIFEHGGTQCPASLHAATTCNTSTTGLDKLYSKRPGGGRIELTKQADGSWEFGKADVVLQKQGDGTWLYEDKDGSTELYNAGGQPLQTRVESGSGLNFNYTSGKLASVAHTSGRSMSLTWNGSRVSAVTAPNSEIYSYGYTAGGMLQSVTYPDGLGTRTYHYEEYGKPYLLTGVSVNGVRHTRYDYDSNQRVISSGLEGGFDESTFVYASDRTTVTNTLGQSKIYHLDSSNRIEQIDRPATPTCPAGIVSSQYNTDGKVSLEIDGVGNQIAYTYTSLGRLAEKRTGIAPGGSTTKQQITQYTWDEGELNLLNIKEYGATTSAFLRETVYTYYAAGDTYDRDGMLKTITVHDRSPTAAPARTTTYDYRFHTSGELKTLWVNGPLAGTTDRTTYQYSTAGDLTSVTNGLGHVTTYSYYTGLGQPGRITDPNGLIVDFVYDAKSRMTKRAVKAPGGDRVTSYVYDAYDNLTKVTDSSGRATDYVFDHAGRMTAVREPSAHPDPMTQDSKDTRTLYYNDLNQLTGLFTQKTWLKRVLTGWGNGEPNYEWVTQFKEYGSETWAYDTGGFLSNAYGDNGQNTKFAYNANGDLWKVTDSLNRVTTTAYDTHNRISSVLAPNGGTAVFEYSPLGWLTKVTDREGSITQYLYNGFGDVVAIISPDAGTTTFGYDTAGRLQTLTRADGTVTTYTRDGLGRVLTESATWPAGSGQSGSKVHAYTYDTCIEGVGRLCSVSDPTGSTSYTYLTSGELASQTSVIDGASFALTFAYDVHGRLYTATYPNGIVLRYGYTAAHQVKQIEAQIGGVWQFVIKNAAWQPFGGPPIGYTYGNNLLRNYTHDLDGRVTAIDTGVSGLDYTYNANDLVTAITNSNGAASQTFGYDTMSALTSQSSTATGAHGWAYDDNGNRTSHTWGAGTDNYTRATGTNRLINLTGARPRTLTHDANGNLKTEARGGVTVTRKYDGYARLVELVRPSAQSLSQPDGTTVNLPAGNWQYGINALGQRASKYQVGANLRHRALYSPGSLLLGQTNANSTNLDTIYVWLGREPVGIIRNNQVHAVHADHLGRPEAATNSTKAIVWRANNYAFDRKVTTDSFGGLDIGFPGQVYDTEAATWYNVFRNYDASTGRYAQADPIGLIGSLNLYTYVGGNPVGFVDPLGLYCLNEAEIRSIAGGLAGAGAGAIAGSSAGPGTAVGLGAIGGLFGAGLGYLDGMGEDIPTNGGRESIGGALGGVVGALPEGRPGIAGGGVGGAFGGATSAAMINNGYGRNSSMIVGGATGGTIAGVVAAFFKNNSGLIKAGLRGGGIGAAAAIAQTGLEEALRAGNNCSCPIGGG